MEQSGTTTVGRRFQLRKWLPLPFQRAVFILPFLLSSASIATLLFYFIGVTDFASSIGFVLLPAAVALVALVIWGKLRGKSELVDRLAAGIWAGTIATFTYDVVRVPIAIGGVPVFKAISYFGTIMLDQPAPTVASELAGWIYHLSNGIGFGLMYVLLFTKPRWWTAVGWGLALEGVMLLTPYAEVFGYRMSQQFLLITIGAHIVYGLTLWAALRWWTGRHSFGSEGIRPFTAIISFAALSVLGIGMIAADFHARHAKAIPRSPPSFLGAHLYTTWDVLEPDRVAALWVQRRFVNSDSRFHFVAPFSRIMHGKPFDTPEAEIRRAGSKSATEVLVARHNLDRNAKLVQLARMTHLYEITPWMLPSDRSSHQLGLQIKMISSNPHGAGVHELLEASFAVLDRWYAEPMQDP